MWHNCIGEAHSKLFRRLSCLFSKEKCCAELLCSQIKSYSSFENRNLPTPFSSNNKSSTSSLLNDKHSTTKHLAGELFDTKQIESDFVPINEGSCSNMIKNSISDPNLDATPCVSTPCLSELLLLDNPEDSQSICVRSAVKERLGVMRDEGYLLGSGENVSRLGIVHNSARGAPVAIGRVPFQVHKGEDIADHNTKISSVVAKDAFLSKREGLWNRTGSRSVTAFTDRDEEVESEEDDALPFLTEVEAYFKLKHPDQYGLDECSDSSKEQKYDPERSLAYNNLMNAPELPFDDPAFAESALRMDVSGMLDEVWGTSSRSAANLQNFNNMNHNRACPLKDSAYDGIDFMAGTQSTRDNTLGKCSEAVDDSRPGFETAQKRYSTCEEDVFELVQNILKPMKARDIVAINVRPKTSNFDFMIFATCEGSRHIQLVSWSISSADSEHRVVNVAKRNNRNRGVSSRYTNARGNRLVGPVASCWEVVPVGRILVNLMTEIKRQELNLERKWVLTSAMDAVTIAGQAVTSEGRQVRAHGLWTLSLNLQDLEDFEVDYCKDALVAQL